MYLHLRRLMDQNSRQFVQILSVVRHVFDLFVQRDVIPVFLYKLHHFERPYQHVNTGMMIKASPAPISSKIGNQ
jgi:hypothetical protein